MHRQFERAYRYKQLPQNDDDESDQSDEEKHRPKSLCHQIKKQLPDVESDRFNIVVGIVIMVNAIVLGLETDLGQENFIFFEHFFGVFFTSEMALRIATQGCGGYVSRGSNCFDCLLVVTGDFDLWISPFLQSASGSGSSGSSRLLKLLRMFRVMRIVRLFKMFHELQIILEAFVKALHTVMWVGLLTIILNYICAVFLTQTIGQNADMWGDEDSEAIKVWFGNIGNSMRTLFIIITLAEWDQISLTVAKRVNGLAVFILAIAYITLTAFTMVSLITGIISEELVGAQKEDEFHKLEQIEQGKTELAATVKSLLDSFDTNGDGLLSDEEVKNALQNTELKFMERLQALEISMEMEDFLSLIKRLRIAQGSSDEVAIDSIVQSLKHLSGTATSASIWDLKMHVLQLLRDNTSASKVLEQAGTSVDSTAEDIQKSNSETSVKVDQVVTGIAALEEKLQRENSKVHSTLNRLMDGLVKLDVKVQDQKCRTDDRVMDRMAKLEVMVNALSSHLAKGAQASAAGTGESITSGGGGNAADVSDEGATRAEHDASTCAHA